MLLLSYFNAFQSEQLPRSLKIGRFIRRAGVSLHVVSLTQGLPDSYRVANGCDHSRYYSFSTTLYNTILTVAAILSKRDRIEVPVYKHVIHAIRLINRPSDHLRYFIQI